MVYQAWNVPTLEEFSSGEWKPARYRVLCYVTPTKKNHISKPLIIKVGDAKTIMDAEALIAKDRASMNETFGGLLDAPGSSGRHYEIFEAVDWKKL